MTLRHDQLPKTLNLDSFIEKPEDANKDVLRAYVKGIISALNLEVLTLAEVQLVSAF